MNTRLSILLLVLFLPGSVYAQSRLTVLHHGCSRSALLVTSRGISDYGGIARVGTLADSLRSEAERNGSAILLGTGDYVFPGREYNAGLDDATFYDAVALDLVDYDALALGDLDFFFGPNSLAGFIATMFNNQPQVLCANADFSGEPDLQDLNNRLRLVPSMVIEDEPGHIGVIAAVDWNVERTASPGAVDFDNYPADALQDEIGALAGTGIDRIIVISHLADFATDIALARTLHGFDIFISGNEVVLANDDDPLLPEHGDDIIGTYPLAVEDARGDTVYVAGVMGENNYLGRLTVTFDDRGRITQVHEESGPLIVAGIAYPGGVRQDPVIIDRVVEPVSEYINTLDTRRIAVSEVRLDGWNSSLRTSETNLGDLLADALRWQAGCTAPDYGIEDDEIAVSFLPANTVALDDTLPPGEVSEENTWEIAPDPLLLTIRERLPPEQFKILMEQAVSEVEQDEGDPDFMQIAGFKLYYNTLYPAREVRDSAVVEPGQRVRRIMLDDSTLIVSNGRALPDAPGVTVVTLDGVIPHSNRTTHIGITFQQAVSRYIRDWEGLTGIIPEDRYPEGGTARITRLDTLGVGEGSASSFPPRGIILEAPYPNPFNPLTYFSFSIPGRQMVRLAVYDLQGRLVRTLLDGSLSAGSRRIVWDGLTNDGWETGSGIYIIRLRGETAAATRRVVKIK